MEVVCDSIAVARMRFAIHMGNTLKENNKYLFGENNWLIINYLVHKLVIHNQISVLQA